VLRWRATHYTCFLSADGEIDTAPLIDAIWRRGKVTWLPCLGKPKLRFRKYTRETPLQRGSFGIHEPARGAFRSIRRLDVILTPLVVFDAVGNRMGMGGGFYDRTFAFLKRRAAWRRPKLIGIAFECQQVDEVPVESWDVPLDGILTERGFRRFSRQQHRSTPP
jgi:5-formyltetrahydrofolate cyclo-ligase